MASTSAASTSVKSIEEQYRDGLYSHYVESPVNSALYEDYYHYSFFVEAAKVLAACQNGCRILDLGCGNCILGRKILTRSGSLVQEVVGVDASSSMLDEARRLCAEQRHTISLVQGRAEELSDDLGLFDFVISGFFLTHVDSKQRLEQVFEQIASHLKPGGRTLHIHPLIDEDGPLPDGYAKRAVLPLEMNGSITEIELYDHHWEEETFRRAVEKVGLVGFSYMAASLAPESHLTYESLPGRICILTARKP